MERRRAEGTSAKAPGRQSLLRSSAVMASGTMVSRILGFVRSALLIAAVGQSAGVGAAFQVANTLPNTVYNLLAAGLLDAILVPQIVRALRGRAHSAYVNRLLTLAGSILFVLTLVMMIASPLLVTIMAGFSGPLRTLTITFSIWCLPQIFFYGAYNLLGQLLNARGVFGPYMWAPVVNNVVGIAGLLVFLWMWGSTSGSFPVQQFTHTQMVVLAGSSTLGVVVQAVVLILPLRRSGTRVRPDFHFRGTSFRSASRVAGWTFATLLVSQLGVISTTQIATRADAWAESTHTLVAGVQATSTAFMIFMVPQSLITVSLATAIFTRLANAAAENDGRRVARNYELGVRMTTALTLLAAAMFMAGANPIMQVLLAGASNEMVSAFALVLVFMMPGVASTGIVLMSQRVFYAYEDARPVFLMGIIPTLVQLGVGWSVFALAEPRWWAVGAAAGETACRLLQGLIAVFWVAHKVAQVNPGRLIFHILVSVLAFVPAALAGSAALHVMGPLSTSPGAAGRLLSAGAKLIVVGIVATLVYWIVLRVFDRRTASHVVGMLNARLHLPRALVAVLGGAGEAPGAEPNVSSNTVRHGGDNGEGVGSAESSREAGASMAAEDRGAGARGVEPSRAQRAGQHPDVARWLAQSDATPQPPEPPEPPAQPAQEPEPEHAPVRRPGPGAPQEASSHRWGRFLSQGQAYQALDRGMSATDPTNTGEIPTVGAALSDGYLPGQHNAARPPAHERDAAHTPTQDTTGGPSRDSANSPTQDTAHAPSQDTTDAPTRDSAHAPARGATGGPVAEAPESPAQAAPAHASAPPPPPPAPKPQSGSEGPGEQPNAGGEQPNWLNVGGWTPAQPPSGPRYGATRPGSEGRSAGGPSSGGPSSGGPGGPSQGTPGGGSGSGRPPRPPERGGRHIDPTVPAIIFAVMLLLAALAFAISELRSPAGPNSGSQTEQPIVTQTPTATTPAPASSSASKPSPSPSASRTVAPTVTGATVLSWNNDNGDHPDQASALIDNDPSTVWRSRWYEQNQFQDQTNITILLTLREPATVSKITMTVQGSGGELVVRSVNPATPRQGTELATTALSPTTTITLPKPTKVSALGLSFRMLPRDDEGLVRAKIADIRVE